MKILIGCYRVLITALFFTGFGLGALSLSVIAFNLIRIFIRNKDKRVFLSRKLTSYSFKFFVLSLNFFKISDIKIKNKEKIINDRKVIYIANHPSLIDYVILTSILSNSSCVVKGDLGHNFFMKGIISCNKYILNNDTAENIVTTCSTQLNHGDNLIIFPEGTRTRDENNLKFNHGFSRIALAGNYKIRPVVIKFRGSALRKNAPWYNTFFSVLDYEIDFLDCFDTEKFCAEHKNKEISSIARLISKQLQFLIQQSKGNI